MPNKFIKMNKLRTIIRLYEECTGLKRICALSRTSRNPVKKYIQKWNVLPHRSLSKKTETCSSQALPKQGKVIWQRLWEISLAGMVTGCFMLLLQN